MSDWQNGYDGLARPGNNNWTSFNAGIAQRAHEQSMADMSARHHAAMSAAWSATGTSGGASSGGGYGSYTPGDAKILLWIVAIIGGLSLLYAGFNAIEERGRESRRAAIAAERAALQQATDAEWGPVLERALAAYDPRSDVAAIPRARALSPCHDARIGELAAGRTTMLHCAGAAPASDRRQGPLFASIHFDRFNIEYVTGEPVIRHRLAVKALTLPALSDRPGRSDPSPVAIAVERLGRNVVAPYAGRGCVAIAADRIGSNHVLRDGQPVEPAGVFAGSYAQLSAVSIACPSAKGRLALVESQAFRRD